MIMNGLMLAGMLCAGLSLASVYLYCSEVVDLRRACLNKNVLRESLESAYKPAVLNCAKGCAEILGLVFGFVLFCSSIHCR